MQFLIARLLARDTSTLYETYMIRSRRRASVCRPISQAHSRPSSVDFAELQLTT